MSEKEWWQTGLGDDLDKAAKKQARRRGPPRYYMPVDSKKEVTFLDGKGFSFWEHNFRANGHWRNWITCLNKNCPFCDDGNEPYYVTMFTVVDHSEWKDKKDKVHKDVVKVYPAKTKVAVTLREVRDFQVEKKDHKQGLVEGRFQVSRGTDDKSANTGETFQFINYINVKKEFPDAKIFNYPELFAPMPAEDMAQILRGGSSRQEEDVPYNDPDDPGYSPEDDVPF